MSRLFVSMFVFCGFATAGLGQPENVSWEIGNDSSALLELRSSSEREIRARIFIYPASARNGIVSPQIRLSAGASISINLRQFLPEPEGGPLQGGLRILYTGPGERLSALIQRHDGNSGRTTRESLTPGSLVHASSLAGPADPCEGGGDPCPPYRYYDNFVYKEWDVTGDGVTDPYLESSIVFYDTDGNITFSDAISEPPPSESHRYVYHEGFCGSPYPVAGGCTERSCSVAEYTNTGEEIGLSDIFYDYFRIKECPGLRTFRIFDSADIEIQNAQSFYNTCLQLSALHFNSEMDSENGEAISDVIDLWISAGAGSVAYIALGGAYVGPHIVEGAPLTLLASGLFAAAQSFSRAHEFQAFLRESSCDLYAAEERCAIEANGLFDNDPTVTRDVDAITDLLEAKNINLYPISRHCDRP